MKRFGFCLFCFLVLLAFSSCSTTESTQSITEIYVFEDYDSLISIDNSKLKLVDYPVDRIIVSTKGDRMFGTILGNFPKAIVKTAISKMDNNDYDINVVSSKVIEFATKGTAKPEKLIDEYALLASQSCDLFVITDDFSKIPVDSFEVPSAFMTALNVISVYGSDDKINIIIDIKDESLAKTVFILMKAGIVADAKMNNKEIDMDNVSSTIERIGNRIYLYNVDFDSSLIKNSFVSPF